MAGERAEIEERPKRHFEAKLRREFGPVCVEHYFEDATASGMLRIGDEWPLCRAGAAR